MNPAIKTVLFICLLGLSACSEETLRATVKIVPNNSELEQSVNIRLTIENGLVNNDKQLQLQLLETYNPANTYPVTAIPDEKEANAYQINPGVLMAGKYRLIIGIPYQTTVFGLFNANRIKTVQHDFSVHDTLTSNCFNFDDKSDDVMGWSSSHVYTIARDQPVSETTCPGLFFVHTSWPAELNQTTEGGSLFVPIANNCFPKISNQLSEDPHWTFSVKSPDLTKMTEWQQIKSINLRVANNKIPIKILPEVHYTIDKQTTSTIFKDVLRKKYEIAGEGWNTIEYPFELPKEAIVNGVEIHIYGIPEQTVSDEVNSIFIDGICPKK